MSRPPGGGKPIGAIFSTGALLTAMALMAVASDGSTLAVGFRPGCSVMDSAIGGLVP